MTADIRNLAVAHPYNSSNTITIGNGSGLNVAHTGSGYIKPAAHIFKMNEILQCS